MNGFMNGFSFGIMPNAPLAQISGLSSSIASPNNQETIPRQVQNYLSKEKMPAHYGTALSSRYRFLPWLDDLNGETIDHLNAYMEMFRRDDCVKAAVMQKVWAVASLDWKVHAVTKSQRNKMIADFILWNYEQCDGGTATIIEELLIPKLIRKFVVAEKIWRKEPVREGRWKGKRVMRAVRARELATYEEDAYGNITAVLGPDESGGIAQFDPKNFIVMKNLPVFGVPASDMRPVYRWFVAKDTLIKMWLICLEKFGTPFMVAKYPSGNDDERLALEAVLAGFTGRTGAVLPDGSNIEFLNALSSTANFESALDRCDKGIMLAVNGAFLQSLTSNTTGDRGNSIVQKETSELPIWRLSDEIRDVINNQSTPMLIKQNFTHAEVPRISLGAVNEAEMMRAAQLDRQLLDNGMDMSLEERQEYFSRVPPKNQKDSMLAAKKPPAPPFGSPFGGFGGGGGGVPFGGGPTQPTELQPPPPDDFTPADPEEEETGDNEPAATFADVLDAGIPVPGENTEKRLVRLLERTTNAGKKALRNLAAAAIKRVLDGEKTPSGKFFTDAELQDLAMSIGDVVGPAELLGRIHILERGRQAEEHHSQEKTIKFSDIGTDLIYFDSILQSFEPQSPRLALDAFRSLYPSLDVDPDRFGPLVERHAMTLAAATEETLIKAVHDLIDEHIQTGEGIGTSEADIDELLEGMGVAGPTANYSETVFRTNMMDAYNAGAMRQLAESKEMFPVWMYSNPDDGRSRKSHAARNGKYYSSEVPFVLVRGLKDEDVMQCRCTFIPVDKFEWADLESRGVEMEDVGEPIQEFAWAQFATKRNTVGAIWDSDPSNRIYGEAARQALSQQNQLPRPQPPAKRNAAKASKEAPKTSKEEELITIPKKKLEQIVNTTGGEHEGGGKDAWFMIQKENESHKKKAAHAAAKGTATKLENKTLKEAMLDADFFASPVYTTAQAAMNVAGKGDNKSQGSFWQINRMKDTVVDAYEDAKREFGKGPAIAIATVYTGLLSMAGMPLVDKVLPKWAYSLIPLAAGATAWIATFGAARAIKSIYNGVKDYLFGDGEKKKKTIQKKEPTATFADVTEGGFFKGVTPDMIIDGVRKMAAKVANDMGEEEPMMTDTQILEFFNLVYDPENAGKREEISRALKQAGHAHAKSKDAEPVEVEQFSGAWKRQPRDPGGDDGGQWTSGGGAFDRTLERANKDYDYDHKNDKKAMEIAAGIGTVGGLSIAAAIAKLSGGAAMVAAGGLAIPAVAVGAIYGGVAYKLLARVLEPEALEESKEIITKGFARATLGLGPLAIAAVKKGIEVSPIAFKLLMDGMHGVQSTLGWAGKKIAKIAKFSDQGERRRRPVDKAALQHAFLKLKKVGIYLKRNPKEVAGFQKALRILAKAMKAEPAEKFSDGGQSEVFAEMEYFEDLDFERKHPRDEDGQWTEAGPSHAPVDFHSFDEKKLKGHLQKNYGGLDISNIPSLAGAPHDAKVFVKTTGLGKQISISTRHPAFEEPMSQYLDIKNGKKFAELNGIYIRPSHQGAGLGREIFVRQVEYLSKHGFDYIGMHAARANPGNPQSEHRGYHVWPEFGVDQPVAAILKHGKLDERMRQLHRKIKEVFPKAESILDIIDAPGGKEWWRANGDDLYEARFDLNPGSRSMRHLERYLQRKRAKPA